MKNNAEVINLILEERKRQDAKHGVHPHAAEVWLSIMTEEVGEMAEAINWAIFDNGDKVKKINNIQKELIQILAVGFAMYADLENKKIEGKNE